MAPHDQLSRNRTLCPDHGVYSRPRIAHSYSGLCRVSGAGMRHHHYQGRKSNRCQNCYTSHRPHPFLVPKHESLGGSGHRRLEFSLEKTPHEAVKVSKFGTCLFFFDFLFTLTKFAVPCYIPCQKNYPGSGADGVERRDTAVVQSTISMRCGPGSARALRSSSAKRSAVFTDTAGTPIPWLIFTQSITGSARLVREMVDLPRGT
jgi:hypothetical protein